MKRIILSLAILSLSVGLASCTTTNKSVLPSFQSTFKKMENGNTKEAQKELQTLCEQEATAGCALLGQKTESHHPLSIMQGLTSQETSLFSVVAKEDLDLLFVIAENKNGEPHEFRILPGKKVERDFSDWSVRHIEANSLRPTKSYVLFVIGPEGNLWDQRSFSSIDTDKQKASFIIASCMDDGMKEQQKIWPEVMSWNVDYLFLIGDNVYADKYIGIKGAATPELLWKRYAETRNTLALYKSKHLRPILAVWDDHDYGANNGGADYPYKEQAAETFQAFFAQDKELPIYKHGPGVASYLKAFDQDFIFIDNRSFRSPNNAKEGPQTHWGAQQQKWVMNLLNDGKAPSWLIQGDQFFGAYAGFESFEGNHPEDFKETLMKIKKASSPVLFVSGDRHLAELMEIPKQELGYVTYELTSSGVHAKTYPDSAKVKNPRRLEIAAGPLNYMLVKTEAQGPSLQAEVISYTLNKKPLFKKQLAVKK